HLVRVARHPGKRRLEIVIQPAAGKELWGLNVIADPQELGTDIALGALHIRTRLVAPDDDIVRERRRVAPDVGPHALPVVRASAGPPIVPGCFRLRSHPDCLRHSVLKTPNRPAGTGSRSPASHSEPKPVP